MMNALNPVDEFIQICSYRETDRLDVQSEEKMRLCPPTPSRSAVGALALGVALLERSVINHERERAGIPGEIHDELDDDWKSSQAVIIHRAVPSTTTQHYVQLKGAQPGKSARSEPLQ